MISFKDNLLEIDGDSFELSYPIADAVETESGVVVLYNYSSFKGGGQFRNLVSFSRDGKEQWVAELPTTNGMDTYYKITSKQPLKANSYCSYACEIDPTSGKIIEKTFYK